jgi:hypothetical protein
MKTAKKQSQFKAKQSQFHPAEDLESIWRYPLKYNG